MLWRAVIAHILRDMTQRRTFVLFLFFIYFYNVNGLQYNFHIFFMHLQRIVILFFKKNGLSRRFQTKKVSTNMK